MTEKEMSRLIELTRRERAQEKAAVLKLKEQLVSELLSMDNAKIGQAVKNYYDEGLDCSVRTEKVFWALMFIETLDMLPPGYDETEIE